MTRKHDTICGQCSKVFTPGTVGRPPAYCGPVCAKTAYNEEHNRRRRRQGIHAQHREVGRLLLRLGQKQRMGQLPLLDGTYILVPDYATMNNLADVLTSQDGRYTHCANGKACHA